MVKVRLVVPILSLLLVTAAPAGRVISAPVAADISTSDEIITAVNTLRAGSGLPAYQPNPILNQIAQQQAQYMASIGSWTHTGPDGSLPYQRALAAGYLVAGDLSKGGYFSENAGMGKNVTAQSIVQSWMGDAVHQETMLSTTLRDIGAGLAVNGTTYYYVIDCGLSTGGTPVAYTPPAYLPTGTLIPNTPNPDGSIIHIVQKNDTIFGIALAYGVPVNDILALNGLTLRSTIYVGQKLIIRAAFTPTATLPTSTPTRFPTATLWPTSTATGTATPIPTGLPLHEPASGLSRATVAGIIALIVVLALVVAALLALIGSRKRD